MASTPLVEATDLGKTFAGPVPVEALRDATLTIEGGEQVAIVGPSGSGKSTLLNLLGLLTDSSAGSYRLDGLDTTGLSERQRASLRAERIGFVFQEFHLMGPRSSLENTELGLLYRRFPKRERRRRAEEALVAVGLEARIGTKVDRLSGGERQRVAIARAIVGKPRLLLADEPTGNLDEANSMAVLDLFAALREENTAQVIVTHDPLVADHCDRRITLRYGRIESGGPR